MTMKKVLTFALLATMVCSCNEMRTGGDNSSSADLSDSIAALNRENEQLRSETDELLSTLNEIEDGFRSISEAQGRMAIERRGEGANARERIRENMQFIQQTMTQNAELIQKLRERLRTTSANSEQLRRTVENLMAQMEQKTKELNELRAELEAKDIHIAELDEQLANLTSDLNDLQDVSQQQDQTISQQDRQLNSAWYAIGSKRELKDNNILDDGQVLRGDFDPSYFTEIDIRKVSEIDLNSKSVKILTSHPASSYTLERAENRNYTLRINDYQQFWSTSKYLVVQTK